MNVTYTGFAGRSDEGTINGNEECAANLVAFQKEPRCKDLSLTHTLIDAVSDKSRGHVSSGLNETQLTRWRTRNTASWCAARVLARLAPFSDEIAVYPSRDNGPRRM